jgi:hypothetical protein
MSNDKAGYASGQFLLVMGIKTVAGERVCWQRIPDAMTNLRKVEKLSPT